MTFEKKLRIVRTIFLLIFAVTLLCSIAGCIYVSIAEDKVGHEFIMAGLNTFIAAFISTVLLIWECKIYSIVKYLLTDPQKRRMSTLVFKILQIVWIGGILSFFFPELLPFGNLFGLIPLDDLVLVCILLGMYLLLEFADLCLVLTGACSKEHGKVGVAH